MKLKYQSLLTVFVVLVLDTLSKRWANAALTPFQPVRIAGQVLQLRLSYNTGVAFGLFANRGGWSLILTAVVIIGLIVWLVYTMGADELSTPVAISIGMIVGGGIANFVDRLPDGHVTDFLDAGIGAARWPTFNLADSAIVVGVIALIVLTSKNNPAEETASRTEPESQDE